MKTGEKHTASTKRKMSRIQTVVQNLPEMLAIRSKCSKEMWAGRSPKEIRKIAKKISDAQKGRKFSKTHLANLRKANSRPRTKEHCRKLSQACKGRTGMANTWKVELERRRKISETQRGRIPNYNKYRSWYDGPKGRICMRSSWEPAFARWLDHCGIDWQYEPKSFYVGKGNWTGVSYKPDFYLPAQDEYVELKGWFNKRNKRKLKAFRKLYPDIKLYVFFGPQLKKAKVIPFLGRRVA